MPSNKPISSKKLSTKSAPKSVSRPSGSTEIVSHFAQYALGTLGGVLLAFIQGIVLRRILGPESYGTFHFLSTLLVYFTSIHLGIVLAAEREIPILLGQRNQKRLVAVQNTTLGAVLLLAVLGIGLGLLVTMLWPGLGHGASLVGLQLTLAIVLFQEVTIYFETITRGHRNFRLISFRTFLSALLSLVLIALLARTVGLHGALLGLLGANGLMAGFYYLTYRRQVKPELNYPLIRELLAIGFPILLSGLFLTALTNIDILTVYTYLGAGAAGIYSLAQLLSSVANIIPRIMGIVVYPRLLFRYGEEKSDDQALLKRVNSSLWTAVVAASLVVGLLYLLAPPLIIGFLPSYQAGLRAAQTMLIMSVFIGIVPLQGYYLIARKQLGTYSLVNFIAVTLTVAALLFLAQRGTNLPTIAFVDGLGYVLNSLLLYITMTYRSTQSVGRLLTGFLVLYLPFFYIGGLAILAGYLTRNIDNVNLAAIAALGLFVTFIIPVLLLVERRSHLLTDLIKVARGKAN